MIFASYAMFLLSSFFVNCWIYSQPVTIWRSFSEATSDHGYYQDNHFHPFSRLNSITNTADRGAGPAHRSVESASRMI